MPNTRQGFTLIELLIVVSIIAILSVIGLIVYSNFQKQARDSKRQSDLKVIQSALEEYRADQFYYPSALSFGSALTAGSKTYLNKIPNDPTGNPEYSYVPLPSGCSGASCTSYCLSAMLETVDLTDECAPASGRNLGVTRP